MSSYAIEGVNAWKFSLLSAPEIGHATISVDGLPAFEGKALGNHFEFAITDPRGGLVLRSAPEYAGRWGAFLGQGSHVIRDASGEELARIRYGGLFGFRRTVVLGDAEFSLPRRRRVLLPEAVITPEHGRVLRAEIGDGEHRLAYLGVAFYMWLREDNAPS